MGLEFEKRNSPSNPLIQLTVSWVTAVSGKKGHYTYKINLQKTFK